MNITECTNHVLAIVSSETNYVSVVYQRRQFPAQIHRLLRMMLMSYTVKTRYYAFFDPLFVRWSLYT